MKNLFHSVQEGVTFWVKGYDCQTNYVDDNIKYLIAGQNELSKITGIPAKNIKSTIVDKSSRYKHMRVFYADDAKSPNDSFQLHGEWSMWKWLNF